MSELSAVWNWNPLIGALLALAGWRYMNGVWLLWRRAGTGRGVSQRQVAAFWAGWLATAAALISPIETMSSASLSVHMIQHMLLMMIAPPLIALGLPPVALMGMVPPPWRQGMARWWHRRTRLNRAWTWLNMPAAAWAIFALVLWVWHVPPLYQLAVEHAVVHLAEHASFFGAALLFWRALARHNGPGVLLVFTTALHSGLLGALMTFSNQTWYTAYGTLADQQVAGLIMWVPGGIILTAAGLALLWRWLDEMESNNAKITA